MTLGTWMMVSQNFTSVFPLTIGGTNIPVYSAFAAIVVNLTLCVILTPIFRIIGLREGQDATLPSDYQAQPVANFRHISGLVAKRPSELDPVAPTSYPAQAPSSLSGSSSPVWNLQNSQPQLMPLENLQDPKQTRR
jgi:hypothetical protein